MRYFIRHVVVVVGNLAYAIRILFNSISTLLMVLDSISPNSYWSIIFNLGGRELTATIMDRRWSGQLIQTRIKNKCYPFHSDFE